MHDNPTLWGIARIIGNSGNKGHLHYMHGKFVQCLRRKGRHVLSALHAAKQIIQAYAGNERLGIAFKRYTCIGLE